MAEPAAATASTAPERRHGWWIFGIWLPLTVLADLLIWFLLKPHFPPGDMTSSARHQQFDLIFMALLCVPVLLLVWIYFGYALITWRRREGDDEDGPPLTGHTAIQATWIVATSVIVLGLFAFGTVELIVPAGAGAGEGPSPIWKPGNPVTTAWSPGTNDMLKVQVIGQEWYFTYRYPQFGGMETTQLMLPKGAEVEFDVTSIDVIHSFWAYQLGVKADANPQVNNIAYTKPQQLGSFIVRCNELCGLWHATMFNSGSVVTPGKFDTWAKTLQAKEQSAGILAALPPYAATYHPDVLPQLAKVFPKILGITGPLGYYYPRTDPVPA